MSLFAETFRRVAILDGSGASAAVALYWEGSGGDLFPMEWPSHWPEGVSRAFLESNGFAVIGA